ncbi:MAG: hypothetical protein ACLFV7_00195 [Phycisphaerae bacterium]
MTRRRRLGVLLAIVFGCAGCGTQGVLLGSGANYVFTSTDAITSPGKPVNIYARVEEGDMLQSRPGAVVRFYTPDGRFYKAAATNEEGIARVSYTPESAGDHELVVDVSPMGLEEPPPQPRRVTVFVRPPGTPILLVDMDKTVVASGFQTVLISDPEPMERSGQVLRRAEGQWQVVYLTHRPDYFSTKSRQWLRRHDYPSGPLLLSTIDEFLQGSGAFKTQKIRRLQETLTNIQAGIGDKVSDAMAYHDTGLKSVLVLPMPPTEKSVAYRQLAASLEKLPEEVNVVADWSQVERVLFDDARYPPGEMMEKLRSKAEELEKAEEGTTRPEREGDR